MLRRAKRARIAFKQGEYRPFLVLETEAITYRWPGEEGTYPNLDQVTPTEFQGEARFDTTAMLRAALSVSALVELKDVPFRLAIGEGHIRVSNLDNTGEAEVEALTSGEAETGISGGYLAQAAKLMGAMAQVKVASPQAPIAFGADGYTLLIMPMFVGDVGKAPPEAETVAAT